MATRAWNAACLAIVFCQLATPAWAEIKRIRGEAGNICVNPECLPTSQPPALQGGPTVYTLLGPWTDHIYTATFDREGVSAAFTSHTGLLDPSVKMTLTVGANTAPGPVRITLRNREGQHIGANPIDANDDIRPITILVVRRGTISSISVPRQTTAFTSVDVTVTGQNIGNAKADGMFAGAVGQSATVISNTDTQAVVRVTFTKAINEVTGKIRLWDKACSSCVVVAKYFYDGTDSGSISWSTFTIEGPNEIREIKVTTGTYAGFISGQKSKVRVTLRESTMEPTTSKTIGTVTDRSGPPPPVYVYWKVTQPEHFDVPSGKAQVVLGTNYAEFEVTSKLAYGAGCTCYFGPPGGQLSLEVTLNDTKLSPLSPTYKKVTFFFKQ